MKKLFSFMLIMALFLALPMEQYGTDIDQSIEFAFVVDDDVGTIFILNIEDQMTFPEQQVYRPACISSPEQTIQASDEQANQNNMIIEGSMCQNKLPEIAEVTPTKYILENYYVDLISYLQRYS